jgi:endo-1,4-beta-xylanase
MASRPLLKPGLLVLSVAVLAGGFALRRSSCAAGPAPGALRAPSPGSLRDAASNAGISLGASFNWHAVQTDAEYVPALLRDFDAVTLENATKWGTVEHSKGDYDWSRADQLVSLAQSHGLAVRGHPLVWDEHVPAWVPATVGAGQFSDLSDGYLEAAVSRYEGRITAWDVVNELIEDDGQPSTAPFFTLRGPDQAERAFQLARAQDTKARLFVNDFAIGWDNERSRGLETLVRRWKKAGVPVDGIGLQAHLKAGSAPSQTILRQRIQAFAALGLAVELTELDVRVAHLDGADAGRSFAQARAYYDAVAACVAEPACTRVTFWSVTDRHTSWPAQESAGLLDNDYAPKPAWRAVRAALQGRRMPGCDDTRVPNGRFEEGIGGWVINGGTGKHTTGEAAEGQGALRVRQREGAWAGPMLDATQILSEGVTWQIGISARVESTRAETVKLTLREDTADGRERFTPLWEGPIQGGVWTPINVTLDLDLDGPPAGLWLYVEGPPGPVDLSIDGATVAPVCP